MITNLTFNFGLQEELEIFALGHEREYTSSVACFIFLDCPSLWQLKSSDTECLSYSS